MNGEWDPLWRGVRPLCLDPTQPGHRAKHPKPATTKSSIGVHVPAANSARMSKPEEFDRLQSLKDCRNSRAAASKIHLLIN